MKKRLMALFMAIAIFFSTGIHTAFASEVLQTQYIDHTAPEMEDSGLDLDGVGETIFAAETMESVPADGAVPDELNTEPTSNLTEETEATTPELAVDDPQKETEQEIASNPELRKLSIHYYIEETTTPIAASYYASLPQGAQYTVPSPTIEEYTLLDTAQSQITGTLTQDTTILVYYQYAAETATYVVEYIGKDVDGSNETLLERVEGQGKIGKIITIADKTFPGYVREPSDMTLEITADGNAKKVLYYIKQPSPSIIFNTGGSYVPAITAEPGTDISQQIEQLPVPTKNGYLFESWDCELPDIMPEETLTVNAIWKVGESSYTVQFYFENANNDGYTWNKSLSEVRTAVTNSTVTATQSDMDLADESKCADYEAHKGSPFYGFDYDHCEDVVVTETGESVLKLYYNREIWTIRLMENLVGTHAYQRDYNTTRDEFSAMEKVVWLEFSGKFGSNLPGDFPDYYALTNHAMERKETAAQKYQRTDLIYAGHIQIADDSFDNGGELRYTKWCTFDSFSYEDAANPKSHILHAYPAVSEKTYFFHLTWMGEKLSVATGETQSSGTSEDYEQVFYKLAGPVSSQTAGFTAPSIPGFTYKEGKVHSNYQSTWKCTALMWMPPVGGAAGDWHGPGCTCNGNYLRIDERDDWDPVLQACTIQDDYLNASTSGLNRINVAQNTIFYLQREAYAVYFHSGDDVVRTVQNVYYQQPLNRVPTAEGKIENLLEYVPEIPGEKLKFSGWYLSPEDFSEENQALENTVMPAGELHLYAKWEVLDCVVRFESTGGSEVPTQMVPMNQKAVLPQAPTRAGYSFIGWLDENGHVWSFEQEITRDITLYAWWKPLGSQMYQIQHIMKDSGQIIAQYTAYGMVGDTYVARALHAGDEGYQMDAYLVPDAPTKSITLTDAGENKVVFYYQLAGIRDYRVSYYLEGTSTKLYPDKEVTSTRLSVVTEFAQKITGYSPTVTVQTVTLTENGENHIIFYYRSGEDASGQPEPALVILKAQKLLDGKIPEGERFAFVLKNASGTTLQTKSSVNGVITFDALSCEKAGEYVYTIAELPEKNTNVQYDNSVYTVNISVHLSQDGKVYTVDISVMKDGKAYTDGIVFVNQTKQMTLPPDPTNPKTADTFLLWQFVSILFASSWGLLWAAGNMLRKRRNNQTHQHASLQNEKWRKP